MIKNNKSISAYYKNLPKKRMATGVLFFNSHKELLLVKPIYNKGWSIPGGVINKNESPRQAGIRESQEELGIVPKQMKFIAVDYMSRETSNYATKDENLQFIFYGGTLNNRDIKKIHIQKNELREYRFANVQTASKLLRKNLKKRIEPCLLALKKNTTFYLETGMHV